MAVYTCEKCGKMSRKAARCSGKPIVFNPDSDRLRYFVLQLAESHLTRWLFRQTL